MPRPSPCSGSIMADDDRDRDMPECSLAESLCKSVFTWELLCKKFMSSE